MSSINARAKGANGEREFCDWLFKNTSLQERPTRNLEQVRSGGADVIVPPFCVEVKRRESLDLLSAWIQCRKAADALNLEPVVAYRFNRKPWCFLISARHIGCGLGFVQLDERTFKHWIEDVWQPS